MFARTQVLRLAKTLPALHIQAVVQPVTRGILRLTLRVLADFLWQARFCWGYFSAVEGARPHPSFF